MLPDLFDVGLIRSQPNIVRLLKDRIGWQHPSCSSYKGNIAAIADRKHGDVIFIGEKSIALTDVGGQVRALTKLVREAEKWDWINRIWFLER